MMSHFRIPEKNHWYNNKKTITLVIDTMLTDGRQKILPQQITLQSLDAMLKKQNIKMLI